MLDSRPQRRNAAPRRALHGNAPFVPRPLPFRAREREKISLRGSLNGGFFSPNGIVAGNLNGREKLYRPPFEWEVFYFDFYGKSRLIVGEIPMRVIEMRGAKVGLAFRGAELGWRRVIRGPADGPDRVRPVA